MNDSFQQQMEPGRRALLSHIASVRDAHLAEILNQARQESAEIIERARRQARAQVHAALVEEHRRRDSARQRVWGEMHAVVRKEQYHHIHTLLEQSMSLLEASLLTMWKEDTDCRMQWFRTVLHVAADRLIEDVWVVEHPRNWSPHEADAVVEVLAEQHPRVQLKFRQSAEMRAGFRLRDKSVTLDGTLGELMRNSGPVKGALLGVLVRMPDWLAADLFSGVNNARQS